MASITTQHGGRRIIQFVGRDRKRRSVRLGVIPLRNAETICRHVEALAASQITGHAVDGETARWVADLSPELSERLAAVGLLQLRATATLGTFLANWLAARPAGTKPATRTVYGHTIRCLKKHFGDDCPLAKITPADAVAWSNWLRTKPGGSLADNTARRRCGFARQFFRDAVDDGLIPSNPFADRRIKTAVHGSAAERNRYVTLAETAAILEWCRQPELRAIVVLCRLAGLRCPSEIVPLTWEDVAWERGRLFIRSPKTAHHDGGDAREVPLFPEVRRELESLWHSLPDGTPADAAVFARVQIGTNLRTQLEKIIRRAGVKKLPKIFVNLRASAACDLVDRYGIRAAKAWLGHSAQVMLKHYDRGASENDFRRAIEPVAGNPDDVADGSALRKAVQSVLVPACPELSEDSGFAENPRLSEDFAANQWSLLDSKNRRIPAVSCRSAAEGAQNVAHFSTKMATWRRSAKRGPLSRPTCGAWSCWRLDWGQSNGKMRLPERGGLITVASGSRVRSHFFRLC